VPWGTVRGHDQVVADMRRNVEQGRFPHAFLFVGPDGVGKRTFALTLASALLCERNPESALDPCGRCPSCLQVMAERHPDVLMIRRPEEKHELPIKLIRELCIELGLKPMNGSRRIAVVDDADDLNEEASNAFLKTLEEPPDGAVLILIGSSPELQLDTVVSRCRVVRFQPLDPDELAAVLFEHGLAESQAAALRLAVLGEGSVGRALGLADPTLEPFRRSMIDEIAAPEGFNPPALARRIETFVKDAGKESSVQRGRASLLFGELARLFRGVLWQAAGLEAPSPDAADQQACAALAERLEPEDVFLLADRCLEADYQVRRKAYMPLILESLMQDVGKLVNGRV
jgi:DNA polymerase III subunit delta'